MLSKSSRIDRLGTTYAGCQDAGSSFIEVESPDAPHAICDEGQHISVRQRESESHPIFHLHLGWGEIGWVGGVTKPHISPPFREMTILS